MGPIPFRISTVPVHILLVLLLSNPSTSFRPPVVERSSGPHQPQPSNVTGADKRTCSGNVVCKPGILLPVWLPLNPPQGERAGRAVIYFLCLMYIFLGVSIIAERFMASIEVITSQVKEITITKPDGETTVTTIRIWNETVSNLTLMALGSSAPEILLSVIEVCGHNFDAGELGPGTIVGSAAFNMFVIIGICVWVIPDGESRKIKHLRVFFITSFWSIFAYIWLYLILAVISPGIVEVWEAMVTLLYFPVCVLLAWIADRRLLFYKYLSKRYRADKRHGIVVEMEGDITPKDHDIMDGKNSDGISCPRNSSSVTVSVQTSSEMDQNQDEVVRKLKDLRDKHPEKNLDQLIEMANYSTLVHRKKSRAFYRVQATRLLIGAGNLLRKHAAEYSRRTGAASQGDDKRICSHICFESAQYLCTENCGTLSLWVILDGGTAQNTFYVDYRTENGSANAGADYEFNEGTLIFKPGETRKEIKVNILDDDIFEEDEHFFVRLQNLRLEEGGGEGTGCSPKGRLVEPLVATVTILDDDHAGIFTFGQGFCGQKLKVHIINVEEYEKQENFFIVLKEPKWVKRGHSGHPSHEEEEARRISEMGKPILGEHSTIEIIIEESCEFKTTVDKLLKDTNMAAVIGSRSWKEQFIEAVTVSAGDIDDDSQDQPMPNCFDHFMHILCIFWKILFACIPPTEYWNGWACFIVSISVIGFLTAIIGDLASHFGCTVGLRDTVTAVVFVALGTSLPDTFASKVAATQDQYADASVGNVTGSNAVNVFLGIGVAWSVAAIYWEVKGKVFRVDVGSLAFSVTLFTIFAFLTMGVLMIRRRPSIGGELGGPRTPKILTSMILFGLWFLYILFSSLEAYCHIKGF